MNANPNNQAQKTFRRRKQGKRQAKKVENLAKKIIKEEEKLDKAIGKALSRPPKEKSLLPLSRPKSFKKKIKKKGFWQNFGSAIVPGAAEIIGSMAGGPSLGALMKAGATKIFGSGDYYLAGDLVHGTGGVPEFGNINKDGLVLAHREYIGDVISSTTFKQQKYSVNAGLPGFCKILAAIATQFEFFDFLGLAFYYESLSATAISNSTNMKLGEIILTSIYDPDENMPDSLDQVLNRQTSSTCRPQDHLLHGWECRKTSQIVNKYTVRSQNELPSTADIKFYDPGYLVVTTNSNPADDQVLGRLWCTYKVKLMTLKPPTGGVGGDVRQDMYNIPLAGGTAPLGLTDSLPLAGSTIGTRAEADTGRIYFPNEVFSGMYLILIHCAFASGVDTAGPNLMGGTGCTEVMMFHNGLGAAISSFRVPASYTSGYPQSSTCSLMVVEITDRDAYVTVGGLPVAPTGNWYTDVCIIEVNPNLVTSFKTVKHVADLLTALGVNVKNLKTANALNKIIADTRNQDGNESWEF